jgi:hypothetical protein
MSVQVTEDRDATTLVSYVQANEKAFEDLRATL